jgi:hypothetical protein
MNEDYAAPCGGVLGVQDADPRSSKELRPWQKEGQRQDEKPDTEYDDDASRSVDR